MKKSYWPRDKQGRLLVCKSMANKLPSYAVKYNITNAQVKDVQDGAVFLEHLEKCGEASAELAQSVTMAYGLYADGTPGTLNTLPTFTAPTPVPTVIPAPGIFGRVKGIASMIKNHVAYNQADGEDLGIEGPDVAPKKASDLQPVLSGKIIGSHVVLNASKSGTQGFEVWGDHGTGTFIFIGFSTSNKFTDPEALPSPSQEWRYKAIYHKNNVQVGQWSLVFLLTVVG